MSLSISEYSLQLGQEAEQLKKFIEDLKDKIHQIGRETEIKKIEIENSLSAIDFSDAENWLTLDQIENPPLSTEYILDTAISLYDLN